jgi:hypothetical protein
MKRFLLLFPLVFALSCRSEPAADSGGRNGPAHSGSTGPAVENFDPGSISEEVFNSTKMDVQQFIQNLNAIIRDRDYNTWVSHLGDDYYAEKSSPEYLAQVSEQPRLKTQKIVLSNVEDYFIHVVVPSRPNDRVDDIEFVSPARVKAYTVTPNGQRLRLYDLESSGGTWKIIN